MSTWAALIRKADGTVVGGLRDLDTATSLRHPDDPRRRLCAPAEIGWEDDDFALVAATPATVPDGQRAVSSALVYADGVVTEEATFEDAPAVPRRIAKAVIQERLAAAGLLDEAMAALQQDSLAFSRWFAPGYTEVNADDPGTLALLAAIDADAETIMAE